ncbi:MAG: copper-binding protein, partial [Bacillota bacterium]
MKKSLFKFMVVVVIAILMFGIGGCGAASEEESLPPDENTVIIKDYKFQPAEITIKSGETITWINKDSVKHTATGD